ncbi:MAG: hypothetical protein M0C28_22200 [Candidatus Moduliflexus flocculans]|nr:hypothetical protein [Candidatus Moduliflexus flocculans]
MGGGYAGKFLHVNLTNATCSDFTIDDATLKNASVGVASQPSSFSTDIRLISTPWPRKPFHDHDRPHGRQRIPRHVKVHHLCKIPQTGIWGESACGGTFSPDLKRAGYDGIVIEGKAKTPVYISITDDGAQIMDASHLWGKDIYEATDILKAPDKSLKVLTIGPAGENLVKIAAIGNDKGHFSGRTGLGAVMGSKNLKAIIVKGSKKLAKADEEKYKQYLKEAMQEVKDSALADGLHQMGSDANMDLGMIIRRRAHQELDRGRGLRCSPPA